MDQYNKTENERDPIEYIKSVANLFPENITDMSQLDASDFKDHAGEIWDLVVEAREIIKQ